MDQDINISQSSPMGRVLVVDDDIEILRVLRLYLERKGFSVEGVSDGIKALELMRMQEFDAGVFDVVLPSMDGVQLARECLELDPDMKIILVTGWAEFEKVIQAMRYGAYSFLSKPFDFNEAAIVVGNAIKERQLTIENREYRKNLENLVAIRTAELLQSQAELRLEKEKLENVLRSIGAGLQVIDGRGEIIWQNPIISDWFGEDGNWRQSLIRQSPETAEFISDLSKVFTEGKPEAHNFSLECKDGEVREFQMNCYPIFRRTDETSQAVLLVQEVTELNILRRELLQSEKLATMGELASGLAHEINNPIGIILGFIQNILANISEQHEFYEDLKIVESETFRTSRVIRQLLEYSRQPVPAIQDVCVSEIWFKILQFFDYTFKAKRITVNSHYYDNESVIRVDPNYIHQALVNLVLNAIQAMPEGGTIDFSSRIEINEEDCLEEMVIRITDTGIGIAKEDLSRIFNPFFTLKGSAGTGLGLTNSKRIIEGHGGKIKIESEAGIGTTAIIRLPMQSAVKKKNRNS